MRRSRGPWSLNFRFRTVVRTAATILTALLAILCIFLSWHHLLRKTHMNRGYTKTALLLQELYSVLFFSLGHSFFLTLVVRREPPRKLIDFTCFVIRKVIPGKLFASDLSNTSEEDLEDAQSKSVLRRNVRQTSSSKYVAGLWYSAAGERAMGDVSHNTSQQMPHRSGRLGFATVMAASFFVVVCAHFIVHCSVPAKHRQSQEIVLGLVRFGIDLFAFLFYIVSGASAADGTCTFAAATAAGASGDNGGRRGLLPPAVADATALPPHSLRTRRRWRLVRIALVLLLFFVLTMKVMSFFASVDTIEHLQLGILGSLNPCDAVPGQMLDPRLRKSWVWPAYTHRRFFNFFTGSELCDTPSRVRIGYIDVAANMLVVSAVCQDGTKPRVLLETPDNNEMHGGADFDLPDVISGNAQYKEDLEARYGTEAKARSEGVVTHRDAKTGLITEVDIDPATLKVVKREPKSSEEAHARLRWRSTEDGTHNVFEVPLGRSAAYMVRCEAMQHEDFFLHPVTLSLFPGGSLPVEEGRPGTAGKCTMENNDVSTNSPTASADAEAKATIEPAGNVLVLLFDAISREEIVRTLPRFTQWMREFKKNGATRSGHLVVEPVAQTTLGLSTAGNLCPAFSGTTARAQGIKVDVNPVEDFMNHTIFVKGKAQHGHTLNTALTVGYCDDMLQMVFGNKKPNSGSGGPAPGVDYYMYQPLCHLEFSGLFGNFKGPYSITKRCIDGRNVFDYLFDYTVALLRRQLIERTQALEQASLPKRESRTRKEGAACGGSSKFFFDVTYFIDGHEGTQGVITLIDQALVDFMKVLADKLRFFDDPLNTFIFSADHGNHMGHYYEYTRAGQLERTLPAMVYVIHPEVLARVDRSKNRQEGKALKNFMARTTQVTTPLDLYLTYGDILGIPLTVYAGYATTAVKPASLFDERERQITSCKDFAMPHEDYVCVLDFCVSKLKM